MIEASGRIITFYSYKGGTGRSMALANAAWILASNGYKVLVIDWDLEAPGLYRYFRPFLIDPELSNSPGLINFIWSYATNAMTPAETNLDEHARWKRATDLNPYMVQLDWDFPRDGCIDLICAGQQDAKYAELVNSFDWTNLYRRLDGEYLFSELRRRFKADYDFTLIDSRTGVSDTSGICTVTMPDSVVAFYTLNRQSVAGVAAVLSSIRSQRGDDFAVFPIVTRVELAEKERLEAARKRMRSTFQKFIDSGGSNASPRDYWTDAEILYQPYYAYEEMLAAFGDPTGSDRSPTSLLAAMERLTSRITGISGIEMPLVPETKRREILGHFAGTEAKDALRQESNEDPEERRLRAERYLNKDLGGPNIFFDASARFEHTRSKISAMLVFVSVGCSIFFATYHAYSIGVGFSLYVSVALIAEVCAAISKSIEMTRPVWRVAHHADDVYAFWKSRFRFWFSPNLSTLWLLILAFGSFIAATIYSDRSSPVAISLSWQFAALIAATIGCAAQGSALVGRFDEKMARFRNGSEALKSEVRAYAQGLGQYSELAEPREAWKRFVESAETIVASAREQLVARPR